MAGKSLQSYDVGFLAMVHPGQARTTKTLQGPMFLFLHVGTEHELEQKLQKGHAREIPVFAPEGCSSQALGLRLSLQQSCTCNMI